MIMFNKTSRRFFLGFAGIVVGSIVIAFIAVYFSPESRFEREVAGLQEQYANDIYGGDTPEETLELFIQALESGDVELASKYFVVEKQEEGLYDLEIASKENNLAKYLDILNNSGRSASKYDDEIRYEIDFFDENKQQIHIEIFTLNTFPITMNMAKI